MDTIKVTEINVVPIKPTDGLVGFASCVINESFYLGSIGIYSRPTGGYRLTYPTKKTSEKSFNIYHPINKEAGETLEKLITEKYTEVIEEDVNES